MQADARLFALVEKHFKDVAGFVIAEQLAEFFLVIGHAVFGDHLDKVPLGVAGQGRLAKVRVLRQEIVGLGVHVGEVAAATARHQDLFACLVGVVDQHHLAPPVGGGQCAHQACGASANNHNVGRAQSGVLTKFMVSANLMWERACPRLQHPGHSDEPSCLHREQARSHI